MVCGGLLLQTLLVCGTAVSAQGTWTTKTDMPAVGDGNQACAAVGSLFYHFDVTSALSLVSAVCYSLVAALFTSRSSSTLRSVNAPFSLPLICRHSANGQHTVGLAGAHLSSYPCRHGISRSCNYGSGGSGYRLTFVPVGTNCAIKHRVTMETGFPFGIAVQQRYEQRLYGYACSP
jgi:hypothetical protein